LIAHRQHSNDRGVIDENENANENASATVDGEDDKKVDKVSH
jgi:hypothetical protein